MPNTWIVNIDWTTAGTYDSRNDAERMVDYRVLRGRTQYISSDGNGFEKMTPGVMNIVLDNYDSVYDPYNTSSVLYPHVEPGKYIRVTCNGEPRFAGRIENIEPTGGVSNPQVVITAFDGLKQLQDTEITTDLHISKRTGAAIEHILSTAAQWPAIWSTSIDSGADIIPYWWEDSISAYNAIDRIVQAEFGGYAVLADGTFRFMARGLAPDSVCTLDQAYMLKDIQVPMPYNVVRNCVKIKIHPRILQDTAALWTLQDAPYIAGTGSLEIWGNYTYNNRRVAGTGMVNPVATTDYTANTAEDGSGTNITANITVTGTPFAETVKNFIENGTSAGGYITLLKNRGQAVDSPDASFVLVDTSGTNLKRIFVIDTPWMQSATKAQQYADYLIGILSQANKFPRFQMENQPDYQFIPDLLDRVAITIGKYSIDTTFRIGGIEEQWLTPNGQSVLTTFYTEPFISQSAIEGYWFFPATFPMTFPY